MRACSLLVIPPPKEREPPPGGFPKDLSDLNLSNWAGLVQDVASGLLAPPPNLGSDVSLAAVALLDLLEKTTGWVYCHFCYHLGFKCACMGAFPPSWSQVVGELHDCSWYTCSRDVQVPTTPTRPPSHGLHQMEAAASRGPGSRRSHGPTAPPWGREECWIMGHSEEDHGCALPKWTGPANASATHDDAVCAPDGTCLTTMPGGSSHTLPASGTTTKEACGEGSHC